MKHEQYAIEMPIQTKDEVAGHPILQLETEEGAA